MFASEAINYRYPTKRDRVWVATTRFGADSDDPRLIGRWGLLVRTAGSARTGRNDARDMGERSSTRSSRNRRLPNGIGPTRRWGNVTKSDTAHPAGVEVGLGISTAMTVTAYAAAPHDLLNRRCGRGRPIRVRRCTAVRVPASPARGLVSDVCAAQFRCHITERAPACRRRWARSGDHAIRRFAALRVQLACRLQRRGATTSVDLDRVGDKLDDAVLDHRDAP